MAFKFLESSYSVLFTFITIRSNPSLIETMHIYSGLGTFWYFSKKKIFKHPLYPILNDIFSNTTFIFYLRGNNHYFHRILIILVDRNTKNENFYLQWAYNSGRNNKVARECNFRPRVLYSGELAYDRPSLSCLCSVLETEHPLHLLSLLSSPHTNSDPGKQLNLQVLKMHFVQANPA